MNGCIVRFYHRAFANIARDYGVPPDLVEMAYLHFNDDACRGILSLDDFDKEMSKRLNIKNLDWKRYYLSAVEQMPGMQEVIRWASDNYQIGLLTNIMPGILKSLINKGVVPNIKYKAIIDSSG